jgi:alkylated DNA nucleotide flippase Atl1/TfoX/Sxy family transcriptional regulator of competence genes
MSTQKETVAYMLQKLSPAKSFSTRAMFGEYALYADGIVVALICNDQLYVKDIPESQELADYCDMDSPYPGAKEHYLIEEHHYEQIENIGQILLDIAKARKKKEKPKTVKKHAAGSFSERVIKLALSIPKGRVTTYGAITHASGGAYRQAQSITTILGRAQQDGQKDIPFHRIVYSDGRVWTNNEVDVKRKTLYKKEGIEIDAKGKIKNFKEKLFEFK